MRLVVNVDDLGLHPAVRRAVERLRDEGVVTSASLMANGPDFDAAAGISGVGLGVHLNLLRGQPLADPRLIPSLVDGQGRLPGDGRKLWTRYVLGAVKGDQVELEWARQIEAVIDRGVKPTHLDSEKHIHCWPKLMPIAQRLAVRYGIHWLRRTVAPWRLARCTGGAWKARLLNFWARSHVPVEAVSWPAAVLGVDAPVTELTAAGIERRLRACPTHAVVELACHPGLPRPDDAPLPPWFGPLRVTTTWQRETDALLAGPVHDLLRRADVKLTHYGQLDEHGG